MDLAELPWAKPPRPLHVSGFVQLLVAAEALGVAGKREEAAASQRIASRVATSRGISTWPSRALEPRAGWPMGGRL